MKRKLIILLSLLPVMALLLMAATGTLYRGKFVDGGYNPAFIGDGGGLTNIQNSSVTNVATTVSPVSNQTNYSLTLYPNGYKYLIYTSNTNVNFVSMPTPIGSANAEGYGASVFVNAITSSVTCVVTFSGSGFSFLTNETLNYYVTNGSGVWYNFEKIDGTSSNITAISGGFHRR